jgi:archaetidylinositol phosphate synthase
MTLDKLRPLAAQLLTPFVTTARRAGLSPDGVSLLAFLAATAAGGAFYVAGETATFYLLGAGLVFMNGWLDLVDGALARELDVSSAGGDLLDHVLDRYADIVIISGLAAGIARFDFGLAAVTGVLMTSYLGTQAEAVGMDRVYGGLLGRADRLAIIGITTGIAGLYSVEIRGLSLIGGLLLLLAVVGHITAIQRFVVAMRDLA